MSQGERERALVVALVAGSHVVNHAYFMLLPPLFGVLESDLGVGTPRLGIALGTVGAVVTALQLPLGHVSDEYGRLPVLALSLGAGAVGAGLTALAGDFTTLLLASAVVGVGIAGHHPAHYPLLAAATTRGTRGRAYSVHGFAGAIGFAVPPAAVAGAAWLGVDWRLAVGAIAVVGGAYGVLCLLALRRRVDPAITRHGVGSASETERASGPTGADAASDSRRSPAARAIAGLRSLAGQRAIIALAVLWFATSVAAWGIKQYTAPLLAGTYELGTADANLAVAAMLAVGAVLILAGGWLVDRYEPPRVLAGGYLALVAVAGLLAWGGLPTLAALGLVLLLSATVDAGRPARAALGDALSGAGDVGKHFGLLTIGISGGAAVAPPVLGVVARRAGTPAAFGVIAGVGVIALCLTAVVLRLASRQSTAE